MTQASVTIRCSLVSWLGGAATFYVLTLFGTGVNAQQPTDLDQNKPVEHELEIFPIPPEAQTFSELLKFVEEIDSQEPPGRSESEVFSHQRKIARTVVQVAEKALKLKLEDEELMQGIYFKLQALRLLREMGEPNADQQLANAIDQALKDKKDLVQMIGMKFFIESGFSEWNNWGNKDRDAWIDRLLESLLQSEPSNDQLNMLMSVLDYLGDMEGDRHAKRLLTKLVPHYLNSKNENVRSAAPSLEGIARRLNLPGNNIELKGELLDGSQLDWSQYRGKVVLVDFWAAWCGPCRRELPNVLAMYEAYHEKGFEVLGISLDKTRTQAESYLKQTDIPWATMFSSREDERYWQHPMAVKYGINGIPRAILVDRDGKVVNMNARGRILVQELRRLLGAPVAKARVQQEALVQRASSSTGSE